MCPLNTLQGPACLFQEWAPSWLCRPLAAPPGHQNKELLLSPAYIWTRSVWAGLLTKMSRRSRPRRSSHKRSPLKWCDNIEAAWTENSGFFRGTVAQHDFQVPNYVDWTHFWSKSHWLKQMINLSKSMSSKMVSMRVWGKEILSSIVTWAYDMVWSLWRANWQWLLKL